MINYDYIYASAYLKNQNVWFGQNEGSTIDNEDLTWIWPAINGGLQTIFIGRKRENQ